MSNVTGEYYSLHPTFQYYLYDNNIAYNGKVRVLKCSTRINLQVSTDILYTSQLPATQPILQQYIPSIFSCECFNDDHKPFSEEVKHTEVGHLFEHILLEFLCKEKLAQGCDCADFSGVTNWNWKKNPRGTFHIIISIKKDECHYFYPAFRQAIEVLNLIITTSSQQSSWQNNILQSPRPAMVQVAIN